MLVSGSVPLYLIGVFLNLLDTCNLQMTPIIQIQIRPHAGNTSRIKWRLWGYQVFVLTLSRHHWLHIFPRSLLFSTTSNPLCATPNQPLQTSDLQFHPKCPPALTSWLLFFMWKSRDALSKRWGEHAPVGRNACFMLSHVGWGCCRV